MSGAGAAAEREGGQHAEALTVDERIRMGLGELSAGERKVGRALLSLYPTAGLETVAALASRAGVSAPTVVRFVGRLGFAGYADFQNALMREVQDRMGSPVEQYAQGREVPRGDDLLPFVAGAYTARLEETFRALPPSEFERAVEMLCSPEMRVHVVGGRFSHVLSDYLVAHLRWLRPGVRAVPGDEFSRVALVGDATDQDLLVVFDFRRHDPSTVRLAEQAAAGGARIVLFTDPWLSPVAEMAEVVLPTRVESPSPFDSLVPGMALVEAVITAVTESLGDRGRHRVEELEALREQLDPQSPSAMSPEGGPGEQAAPGREPPSPK
ncbi:MurR/RpiR family transcriptional regulator [Kytococcus sp. Marseille-QA3725]